MERKYKFSEEENKKIKKIIEHFGTDIKKKNMFVGRRYFRDGRVMGMFGYEIRGPCYQIPVKVRYIDRELGKNMRLLFDLGPDGTYVHESKEDYDTICTKVTFGIEKESHARKDKILLEISSHITDRNVNTITAMKSGITLLETLNRWAKEHGKKHSATYGYDCMLSYYYIMKPKLFE